MEEGYRQGEERSTYRMQEQLLQLGCSHTESQSLLGEKLQGRNQLRTCLIPGCTLVSLVNFFFLPCCI